MQRVVGASQSGKDVGDTSVGFNLLVWLFSLMADLSVVGWAWQVCPVPEGRGREVGRYGVGESEGPTQGLCILANSDSVKPYRVCRAGVCIDGTSLSC